MKRLLVFCSTILSVFALAQKPIQVSGKIEHVTVYFSGASITQNGKVSLTEGLHTIEFNNLPLNLDQSKTSIQVPEQVYVLSMNLSSRNFEENMNDPVVKKVSDSIQAVSIQIRSNRYKLDALNTELDLLKKNMSLGGTNVGVNVAELQKASDFYRLKQDELYKRFLSETSLADELQGELKALQFRKSQLLEALNSLSGKVIANIKVNKTGLYNLALKYFSSNAAWKPIYDIRVEEIGKPLEIIQKGKILNNTGVDWKNVSILLSTADPSLSIIRPDLAVWEIATYNSKTGLRNPNNFSGYSGGVDYEGKTYSNTSRDMKADNRSSTIVYVSELSNEFTVADKANIASSLNPQTIEIKAYTLNAWYEYTGIPKIEKMPYLIGKTTDWKNIPLSDGPANIYIGNNFIGESYLNMGLVSDTLEISMGRNKKVAVDYRKKEDMTKKSWIGGNITETFTYEIKIKNNNMLDVVFELWDQVPISKDNDIVVTSLELSGAQKDDQTGKLVWKMTLKPGEERSIVFSYSIKYPKNKPVYIPRFKPLSCPDF